jgi:hypothetical protein
MRIEKKDRGKFNGAWSATFVRASSGRFHNNFKARPVLSSSSKLHGVWFKNHICMTKNVKQQRREKMQLARHVLAKLQPST